MTGGPDGASCWLAAAMAMCLTEEKALEEWPGALSSVMYGGCVTRYAGGALALASHPITLCSTVPSVGSGGGV